MCAGIKKRLSGPRRSHSAGSEAGRRMYELLYGEAFDYRHVQSVRPAESLEKPSEKKGGGRGGESLAHPDGLFKCY